MAYTRIHTISNTLNKAIAYIENPDKTEEQLLISGYNVQPETASAEFKMTELLAKDIKGDYTKSGGKEIMAYHIIQSFSKKDDVSFDEAHAVGKELADDFLNGKYEYVLCTHVDKGHIHNHIIFNATSFYDFKKFESVPIGIKGKTPTFRTLRNLSDRICEEHNLSIIENPQKGKTKNHEQWQQEKYGLSFRDQLKEIIDKAISASGDYEGFKKQLAEAGVEVKEGKHIAFRITGKQTKFTRGNKIGNRSDYTRERIIEHIQNKSNTYPEKIKRVSRKAKYKQTLAIANILNTLNQYGIENPEDFSRHISELRLKSFQTSEKMNKLIKRNTEYKEVAKNLLAYNKCLPIWEEYQSQPPWLKKRYARINEAELSAYKQAAAYLNKNKINTNVDYNKVLNLIKEQDGTIADLQSRINEADNRIAEIAQVQQMAYELLNAQEPPQKPLDPELG